MSLRVQIAAIGRMKQGPERVLVSRYLERAAAGGKALGLSGFDVSEAVESRAGSADSRKSDEAGTLRGAVPRGALMIALDERGKSIGSEALANRLGDWRDAGRAGAVFLIGGADGLDPALVREADLVLSLTAMTWPHQLVRIMLAEQLYRATTILSGHPYHRE